MERTIKLLTVRDACAAMSVGRTRLYELARSGRLRSVKIGERGIRIPVSEIERFVREQLGDDAVDPRSL